MKYVGYIMGLFLYFSVITVTAESLGLTYDYYVFPDLAEVTNPEGSDAFFFAINTVVNYLSAFTQLATFTAPIPFMLSLFFISSFVLGVIVMVVLIIRGV